MDANTLKEIIAGLDKDIDSSMSIIKAEQAKVDNFNTTKEYLVSLLDKIPAPPRIPTFAPPYNVDGTVVYKMKYALGRLRKATTRQIAEYIIEKDNLPGQDLQKMASAVAANFSQKLAKEEDFREVGVNDQGIKVYALKD